MPGDQSGYDEAQAQHGDRRLAAFAFVDIVGYSILMSKDETRTHARWMTILNDVIRPQTRMHHGSIVKSTGDGILAEFPTARDAVAWAREVQRSVVPAAGEAAGTEPPVALRIAVNVGEIFATPDDIYGDSVNLAARLQEYAEPGGIVLSEAVHNLVHDLPGIEVRDLGRIELKHFEHRVRAYAIPPLVRGISVPAMRRRVTLPSIAVLPLENLSSNRDDDYFADGIVEDIIVSLASLRELLVISRGSTLRYRGKQPDPREVGAALGARYVLMGSFRRTQGLMRVSTQLCDADSGASLWGDRAVVPPDELFDVQDNIIDRIVTGIAPHVRDAELRAALRKRPDSFTAYDYTLRALDFITSLDRERFLQARDYLQRAMDEDREFAMPVAWAARWHSLLIGQGWSGRSRGRCHQGARSRGPRDRTGSAERAGAGHLWPRQVIPVPRIRYRHGVSRPCPGGMPQQLAGADIRQLARLPTRAAGQRRSITRSMRFNCRHSTTVWNTTTAPLRSPITFTDRSRRR